MSKLKVNISDLTKVTKKVESGIATEFCFGHLRTPSYGFPVSFTDNAEIKKFVLFTERYDSITLASGSLWHRLVRGIDIWEHEQNRLYI